MGTVGDTRVRRRTARVGLALAILLPIVLMDAVVPAPAAAVRLTGVSGRVSVAGGLNLRTGPGTSYPVVRTLPDGTALTLVNTSGDWFKARALGSTGWVNSWYVTLSGTPSQVVWRGNTARRMVALTFDAGSDVGYTDQILGVLREYGAGASFGLTGAWINANPRHARRIADAGYQLINHSFDHPSFTGRSTGAGPLSPARRLAQLVTTENRLAAVTGGAAGPYWRPPYGDHDAGVLRDAGAAGFGITAMWTIDSLGWQGLSAQQIHDRVVNGVGNGAIVLMHLGSDSQDGPALERIILTLRDRGYAFGTVAQVIAP